MIEEAKKLLDSIKKWNIAQDGDSGDDENDAGNEMRDAAEAFLRATAARNVELAEVIDQAGDLDARE